MRKTRLLRWMLALGLLMVAIIGALLVFNIAGKTERQAEEVALSILEKTVSVSELSTFTAVYHGVAQVRESQKPEETKYYVSYEANIYAGIDFAQIVPRVDGKAKQIQLMLPEVKIIRTDVDIASLDYIFLNEAANTSAVSEEAYKACEADVQQQSRQEPAIYQLARQNAKHIMQALLEPFLEQIGFGYTLEITWEGEAG